MNAMTTAEELLTRIYADQSGYSRAAPGTACAFSVVIRFYPCREYVFSAFADVSPMQRGS
jgi:hypothetical protein